MTRTPQIQSRQHRSRGARSNRPGRYDLDRDFDHSDAETSPHPPVVKTEVRFETAKSLVTYNRSPDLPFDRSINPYRGCEHGCVYCFARPTHAYLGLSPGLDFETRLIARRNAADVLARDLSARRYKVAPIALGTNTDPYQPVERDLEITRGCLDVLAASRHPVAIVTKGTVLERDIPMLAPLAAQGLVRVGVSVTTLDAELSRKMEPRAPTPERRLRLIRALAEAGIPVRVMVSPVVPGLTDHEVESILAEAQAAGATTASWIMLRLPREVSTLWQEWLADAEPGRAAKIMSRLRDMHGGKDYDPRWGLRMRGDGVYAEMIAKRFSAAMRRLALKTTSTGLRTDLFRPPELPGAQLSLF